MNETPDTTNAAADQAASAAEQAAGIDREPLGKPDAEQYGVAMQATGIQAYNSPNEGIHITGQDDKSLADIDLWRDSQPEGTPLDSVRAAEVDQPPPTAEQVLRGHDVTGLGYVLNLQDIENITKAVWVFLSALQDSMPKWNQLSDDEQAANIAAVERIIDGVPTKEDELFAELARTMQEAIKQACDTLIADYLRAPIELVTKHHTPVQTLGPRSIEEARALPMLGVLIEASSRPLDTDDGGIVAFKDHDGTTRRVFVLEDGTLAKA